MYLIGYTVAVVTYHVKMIIIKCLIMFRRLFDTAFVSPTVHLEEVLIHESTSTELKTVTSHLKLQDCSLCILSSLLLQRRRLEFIDHFKQFKRTTETTEKLKLNNV